MRSPARCLAAIAIIAHAVVALTPCAPATGPEPAAAGSVARTMAAGPPDPAPHHAGAGHPALQRATHTNGHDHGHHDHSSQDPGATETPSAHPASHHAGHARAPAAVARTAPDLPDAPLDYSAPCPCGCGGRAGTAPVSSRLGFALLTPPPAPLAILAAAAPAPPPIRASDAPVQDLDPVPI